MIELVIFFIAIVILLGFITVKIHNRIIQEKNAVERAWASVISQERQKNKILPALEDVVKEHIQFENTILSDITKLRAAITALDDKSMNAEPLSEVQMLMRSVTSGIRVTMEVYPELKTAGLMQTLMKEISEQEANIEAALRIFNQNVELFNASIEIFPNSVVNDLLNKEKKITPFYDKDAEASFNYKPKF